MRKTLGKHVGKKYTIRKNCRKTQKMKGGAMKPAVKTGRTPVRSKSLSTSGSPPPTASKPLRSQSMSSIPPKPNAGVVNSIAARFGIQGTEQPKLTKLASSILGKFTRGTNGTSQIRQSGQSSYEIAAIQRLNKYVSGTSGTNVNIRMADMAAEALKGIDSSSISSVAKQLLDAYEKKKSGKSITISNTNISSKNISSTNISSVVEKALQLAQSAMKKSTGTGVTGTGTESQPQKPGIAGEVESGLKRVGSVVADAATGALSIGTKALGAGAATLGRGIVESVAKAVSASTNSNA